MLVLISVETGLLLCQQIEYMLFPNAFIYKETTSWMSCVPEVGGGETEWLKAQLQFGLDAGRSRAFFGMDQTVP